MTTIQKKAGKQTTRLKKTSRISRKNQMSGKRKQAIEKAILFWESHAIDLSGLKFGREEANAR